MKPTEQEFDTLCANAGLYYSQSLHAVLKAVAEAESPLTTYDVHRFAQQRRYRLALPTAYRLLKALVKAKVVVQHDLGDGFARYSFVQADEGRLVDTVDGTVKTFSDGELSARLTEVAQKLGYKLVRYRLVLVGESRAPERKRRQKGHRSLIRNTGPETISSAR